MKLAISGKGGVGKTTFSAMLAAMLASAGDRVIAVDADPDANLAAALGVDPAERITPLAEMKALINERTGSAGGYGGYFKLNPKVDDIPEAYSRNIGDIRLLVLGGAARGGGGCICPETTLLKALLVHLVLGRNEHLVMDMEAGLEHLGRATAGSMDALITVIDPGPWSVQTALRVRTLAGDIGLTKVFAVANRIGGQSDLEAIRARLGDLPLLGYLPEDVRLRQGVLTIAPDGRVAHRPALADSIPAVEKIIAALRLALLPADA
jgi:CO dehydrogenase maturation factor